MSLERIKTVAHFLGSAALAVLALYGVIGIFGKVEQAFGAPNPIATLLANTLVDDASVPLLINYQGTLRDPEGNPLGGYYTMTFKLYDDINALPEDAIWSEQHISITVRSGHFSALLGDTTPFSATMFNSLDRFIGVTVAPYDEMVPRQRFASVPYAIYADRAFSLSAPDGEPYDAVYVNEAGKVGIGTTNPLSAALHINGYENDGARAALRITSNQQTMLLDGNEIDAYSPNAALGLNGNSDRDVTIAGGGGNVGIGTDSPDSKLTIVGPEAAALRISNSSGDSYMIIDSNEIDVWGGSSLHLNRNSTTDVKIGSRNPSDLDVNGDVSIGGNLTVDGNITNFGVVGPTEIKSFGGDEVEDLGSTSQRICFLTKVGFGDLGGSADNNSCRVHRSGGRWTLTADQDGSGNVFCGATCLTW